MRWRGKRLSLIRPGGVGGSPGTLAAPEGAHPTRLTAMAYHPDGFREVQDFDQEDWSQLPEQFPVVWIDCIGLKDVSRLENLAAELGLHRLALEDAFNAPQRSKFEDYDDHHFVVARMPRSDKILETEQFSLFLGEGFVLTIQERPGDGFGPLRERIRSGKGRIRQCGADYLAYALLDSLVDSYFPLLESFGQHLEDLELALLSGQAEKPDSQLHDLGHIMITLRRYLVPLREALVGMQREESSVFQPETRLFLRDCLDHTRQAIDLVEAYRDMTSNLLNLHLSLLSQKMNEVMKTLTIIATIFIPLSFVAGLYGMNFDPAASKWNMPELSWAFGYPAVIGIMLSVGVGMVLWMRKKGWFR